MFHSSRLRVILLSAAAVVALACSAFATDVSWLDGEWTLDVETLLKEHFADASPGDKSLIRKDTNRLLGMIINTKVEMVTIKLDDRERHLAITAIEPQSDGSVIMTTRDVKYGDIRTQAWKRLPDGNIATSAGDMRIVYIKKQP